jgi:hypothetical protein
MTVFGWLASAIASPYVGDVTDPENGRDLCVTKEGSNLDTKYKTLSADKSILHPDPKIVEGLLTFRSKAEKDAPAASVGLFDIDSIFKMTEQKMATYTEQAEKIRAALSIVKGAIGPFSAQMAAQAPQEPQAMSQTAPQGAQEASQTPSAPAQEFDPTPWLLTAPEGNSRVDVLGCQGQRPSCFSGLPGKLYLNFKPLALARETAGSFDGEKTFLDIKDQGRVALDCVQCPWAIDCQEVTEKVGGATPGG